MSTSTLSCTYVKICLCVLFIFRASSSPLDPSLKQENVNPSSITHVSKLVTPALPHYAPSNEHQHIQQQQQQQQHEHDDDEEERDRQGENLIEQANDFTHDGVDSNRENEYSSSSSSSHSSKVESHFKNLLGCTNSLTSQDLTALLASQSIVLSNALQLYMEKNGFEKTNILLHSVFGEKVKILPNLGGNNNHDHVLPILPPQQQQHSQTDAVMSEEDEHDVDDVSVSESDDLPKHHHDSTEQMDINSLRVTVPSETSSEELPLPPSPSSLQSDLRLIDIPVNLKIGGLKNTHVSI